MNDDRLTPPEWLAIAFFLFATSTLTFIAYTYRTPELPATSPEFVYISSPEINISVSGAVKHPKSVIITKGATVKDLLNYVELLPEADLTALKMDKILRKGQKLNIPYQKKKRGAKPRTKKEEQLKNGRSGPSGRSGQ